MNQERQREQAAMVPPATGRPRLTLNVETPDGNTGRERHLQHLEANIGSAVRPVLVRASTTLSALVADDT